ncbi:MAG: hypothetical protein EA384_09670 [Spirochaetaceae bacterium]|nr:MAG: hypothetical protein EA384_09670 [Spirochaetaceae bacterium]
MNRTLLLAANSDAHTVQLAQEALAAGFTVMAAVDPSVDNPSPTAGTAPGEAPGSAARVNRVAWNRRSPISARAMLVQACNIAAPISDIVYLHVPQTVTTPFHEIRAPRFETAVDVDTRGRLFLLREALGYLQREGRGSLTLMFHGELNAETPPLDAEGAGAFLALGRSLFTQYQNEPLRLRGFQSAGAPFEQFARFVLQQLVADNPRQRGRWFKCSTKPTLFPFPR